jgi:hypothetical protein
MTAPIHVFFDSSAIRAESPTGHIMETLRRLSAHGVVQVHVPALVVAEISSQNASHLRQIQKDLRRLVEWLPDTLRAETTAVLHQLTDLSVNRAQLSQQGVEDWLRGLRGTSEGVDASMTPEVFDRYFRGEPPFRTAKNRNDIPDAFIFLTIRAFSLATNDETHVVVGDVALREACAQLPRVTVHEKLSQFLTLPQLATFQLSNPREIRDYCQVHEAELVDRLCPMIRSAVEGSQVRGEFFPGYQGTGFVVSTGFPTDFNFDWSDAVLLTENFLDIPFACYVGDATVEILEYGVRPVTLDETFTLAVEVWASVQVQVDQQRSMSFGKFDVRIDDVSLKSDGREG